MKVLRILISALVVMLHSGAELRVASLIQDHMVIQRDQTVPIWGWANPGQEVTVNFKGQSKKAVSDKTGAWRVNLAPNNASDKAAEMTISTSGNEAILVKDILVGEVWICAGQSNMEMSVKRVPELAPLLSKVSHIRSFQVETTVAFKEQDECEGAWKLTPPNSAVGAAFAYYLQQHIDVPIGIVLTSWGSSSIEAWMPRDMVKTVPHFKTLIEEFDADSKTKNKIQKILDGPRPFVSADNVFIRRQSNILYNAMMHPLAPYACKGMVWYQGERNTQSMHGMLKSPWYSRNSGMIKYGDTMKEWIKRLRQQWENDTMEWLVVMLPGYLDRKATEADRGLANDPKDKSWAWMRESQLKATELANVAVANTIDLGHISDIHPKDKLPIGDRLAKLAANGAYGLDLVASGPVVSKVTPFPGKVMIKFDHAAGLKTTDGQAPKAFWVSDDSKKWVPAQAEIKGQTVTLRADAVKKPLYVRYAFSGKPDVNLVNGADLPAYPFRSDTFAPPKSE